ncbi:ATP-binding cassette domain-containing protein [Candidatus Parabeggiatoa sp. HSG14]|uniref:ATP-binding cassette domain-containing protein n=1 Tax=Candidatus Parabeggiatoa sp. HSG14 TaxID=3055593 RepID=UPI0025A89D42|nr:ATP-binding cassette domain-containing protein [Thiotrichales bacterium HSG14]
MNLDTLVSVQNLSRYYNTLCAVNNISFEVKRGQILGFLGPNGAGKTTTMQIITGTLAPTIGKISVAGHDLLDYPLKAKAVIGYLPENPPLYKEMQVDEYLKFCAKLHNVPHHAMNYAVNRAVEQCALKSVRYRLIGNLSKGYQQRVGIAQAIIHTPSVVVLDEPTIGLDPIQIREIRSLIRTIGEEHSVILSTHILQEVQAVCNHVQIINRGELILSDTISGLFAQMKTTSMQIGLRRPPDVQVLKQIQGVDAIEIQDNNHFRIQHAADNNPAEAVVEKAVAANWGLYELIPEKRTLEQVFVELMDIDNAEANNPIDINSVAAMNELTIKEAA